MNKLYKLGLLGAAGVLSMVAIFNVSSYATVSGINTLVNVNSSGNAPSSAGNQSSRISEDGSIVVWSSSKHDIIPNDSYSSSNMTVLYKRDMKNNTVSYASTNSTGVPVGVIDDNFAMSRTGRYIVFTSRSSNIVSDPVVSTPNDNVHVYLKDTLQGTTSLVDKSSSGVLANGDAGGSYYSISVSDDGRFVLFGSNATNLLPIPGNGGGRFVKDMHTGGVLNPTVSNTGVQANIGIGRTYSSCDGALLVFTSEATNLTPQDDGSGNVYLVDLRNGYKITNLTYSANNTVNVTSFSCNGRYLLVNSRATNLTADSVSGSINHFFRYDRLTGEYSLIDKSSMGYIGVVSVPYEQNSSLVSDDGKVVFVSNDKNLASPATTYSSQVFLRNPEAGSTELVPVTSSGVRQNAQGGDYKVHISSNGKYVLYNSTATNLIPGMSDGVKMLVLSKVE